MTGFARLYVHVCYTHRIYAHPIVHSHICKYAHLQTPSTHTHTHTNTHTHTYTHTHRKPPICLPGIQQGGKVGHLCKAGVRLVVWVDKVLNLCLQVPKDRAIQELITCLRPFHKNCTCTKQQCRKTPTTL
jgi:hypothetical protein